MATAIDHSNFTITNNAPDSFPLGVTTITWTATDDRDNYSTATSTVTIQYTPPPNITLNGVNPQIIELNKNYTELGAVCSDNIDGTISPDIDSSTVDTTYAQSYQVRYDCADNSGNDAIQVTRTVIVQETVTPDITPPSITAPNDITLESTSNQNNRLQPVACNNPDSITRIIVNIGTVFGDAITPIKINAKVKIPIPKYIPP